jgi:hypothetical protein
MGQFGNRDTSYSRANLTMKRGKIATRSKEGSMLSEGDQNPYSAPMVETKSKRLWASEWGW